MPLSHFDPFHGHEFVAFIALKKVLIKNIRKFLKTRLCHEVYQYESHNSQQKNKTITYYQINNKHFSLPPDSQSK